ncbi:Sigma-70 region 2 [Pedobacter terrae]|uniref:Sigma-70 region 2 n=2 Tax=Pedobacter terrae TaxID=405671 RepID=A0A1G7TYR7_9SPHI|nr:Sigma-70 region 2 [Pedobacter terrae]
MQSLYQRVTHQELSIGHEVDLSDDNFLFTTLEAYDGAAFKALYQRYSAAVYGNIIRYVGNEEKAKLILEQTFCEAWRSFPEFDQTKSRIFTWINRLALQIIKQSAS